MNRELRFLEAVRKWVEIHGKITEVSKEASPADDKTWLSRALRGQRPFTFEHLGWVLTALGTEESQFWDFLAAELGISQGPARGLRGWLSQIANLDASQHLILKRIGEVLPLPLASHTFEPVPERVATIRRHRQHHRRVALAEAETWLHELWAHGLKVKRWTPARTAELCAALGAWAAVRRSLGDPSGAATALDIALELHATSPYGLTYADLLETAALVVRDLGSMSVGLTCLQEALSIYGIFEDDAGWIRTCISIGVFAACQDSPVLAEKAFTRCAHHPAASAEDRVTAVSNLAWVWQRYSRPDDALLLLQGLRQELERVPPKARLNISWVEAKIVAQSGDAGVARAAGLFEDLLQASEDQFDPADRLLLFLDFGECLTQLGEDQKLSRLSREMLPVLATLESTPLAQQIGDRLMSSLGTALRLGNVNAELTARVRSVLDPRAASTKCAH